jgi:hypothetical protein
MRTKVGLWIDHRQALIVSLSERGEQTQRVTSASSNRESEGHGESQRSAVGGADETGAEDRDSYYDRVLQHLGDAEAVLIFGPGESTRELEGRLQKQYRTGRIVGVGIAEEMTPRQIAAELRQRFRH